MSMPTLALQAVDNCDVILSDPGILGTSMNITKLKSDGSFRVRVYSFKLNKWLSAKGVTSAQAFANLRTKI